MSRSIAAEWTIIHQKRARSTAVQMPSGSARVLPALGAMFELLRYLRHTAGAARLDLAQSAMALDHAYGQVVNATGPVRFRLGYATYWLSEVSSRREPARPGGGRDAQ